MEFSKLLISISSIILIAIDNTYSAPTSIPSSIPTSDPTLEPTDLPTWEPSVLPTEDPSASPTDRPTTLMPTVAPTFDDGTCKYVAQYGTEVTNPDTCLSTVVTRYINETSPDNQINETSQIYTCDTSDSTGQTVLLETFDNGDCSGNPVNTTTIRNEDYYDGSLWYVNCNGMDCGATFRVYSVNGTCDSFNLSFAYNEYSDVSLVTGVCNNGTQVQCDGDNVIIQQAYTSYDCRGDDLLFTSSIPAGCNDSFSFNTQYFDPISCNNYVPPTEAPTTIPSSSPTAVPTEPSLMPTSVPTREPTNPTKAPTNNPTDPPVFMSSTTDFVMDIDTTAAFSTTEADGVISNYMISMNIIFTLFTIIVATLIGN